MTTHITKEGLLQDALRALRMWLDEDKHVNEVIDFTDDVLTRAAELEQSQPAQISHHEDCWRDPKHHACAVAKIARAAELSAQDASPKDGWQPVSTDLLHRVRNNLIRYGTNKATMALVAELNVVIAAAPEPPK